jgi:1-aminocyclopropane-1-carboxylate deaminase
VIINPPNTQFIPLTLSNGATFPIWIKRLDQIHPFVNGNKWFKLKYNLEFALRLSTPRILSFGGSHSNHIYSLSAAGKILGIKTIGIIRGESKGSSTLDFARANGMDLHFVSRDEYKNKELDISINQLHIKFGEFHLVPEGASNAEGVQGCEEILAEEDLEYDVICLACGTASTLAGIVRKAGLSQKIYGISALKGGDFLRAEALQFLQPEKKYADFEIITDYHFGGYAKWNSELIQFIREMFIQHQLPLDQVYTGKMLFGLKDLIEKGLIRSDQKVLCIHTGGLQGRLPEVTFS